MPHLIVDHSPGVIEDSVLAPSLVELDEALVGSGAIKDEADLKTRVVRHHLVRIGTTSDGRGYVHAQLRCCRDAASKRASSLRRLLQMCCANAAADRRTESSS
jgi:5-carboxymethyl-2-hydroxymuconate isomerase